MTVCTLISPGSQISRTGAFPNYQVDAPSSGFLGGDLLLLELGISRHPAEAPGGTVTVDPSWNFACRVDGPSVGTSVQPTLLLYWKWAPGSSAQNPLTVAQRTFTLDSSFLSPAGTIYVTTGGRITVWRGVKGYPGSPFAGVSVGTGPASGAGDYVFTPTLSGVARGYAMNFCPSTGGGAAGGLFASGNPGWVGSAYLALGTSYTAAETTSWPPLVICCTTSSAWATIAVALKAAPDPGCAAYLGTIVAEGGSRAATLSIALSELAGVLSDYRLDFVSNSTGHQLPPGGLLSTPGAWSDLGKLPTGSSLSYTVTRVDGNPMAGKLVMRVTDDDSGLYWDAQMECPSGEWRRGQRARMWDQSLSGWA